MRYLSLFSGIGTGEKGIEQAYDHQHESAFTESPNSTSGRKRTADIGDRSILSPDHASLRNAECVGFSEIDRHAEAIYRYHWPDHRNFGDATRIVPDELPDFDFLIAGFPCQAFSIAGKRRGFDEARGTLFFEIARILSHKRPAHFLLENVKGLSSHDDGRTIIRIHSILSGLGYRVERVLLNSKDYGVSQNRERVFFIGHLGDGCSGEILSVGEDDAGLVERSEYAPIANCFTAGGNSGGMHSSMTLIGTWRTHHDGRGFRQNQVGLCPTIPARQREEGSGQPVIAVPVLTPERAEKRQNGRRFKENGDESFTLTSQDQHGVFNGQRIRRLTPIECERLQGCQDDHTKLGRYGDEIKEVSDTQRYKGLGNAFTVNVIEAIVSRMIQKGCL